MKISVDIKELALIITTSKHKTLNEKERKYYDD